VINKFILILFVSFVLLWAGGSLQAGETGRKVVVYFFWGQGCPHCEHEKPFLESLKTKHSGFVVKKYLVDNGFGVQRERTGWQETLIAYAP